jgi:hypothetical protein
MHHDELRGNPMKHALGTLGAALMSNSALAHEGHGLAGSHWHATDPWGLIALAAVVAAALWAARRK